MVRLYVDAIGGDKDKKQFLDVYQRVIPAVFSFLDRNPQVNVTVGGDARVLEKLVEGRRIDLVDGTKTPADIRFGRKESALYKGMRGLEEGEYDALFTAGDTRAAVVYASTTVGRMSGVNVMPLIARLPTSRDGKNVTFMDAGASTNSSAEELEELVRIAHAYTRVVHGIERPVVGLLSNGHEEYKGSREVIAAHKILSANNNGINYVGQREPQDYISGELDAIVGCGFPMNLQLKLVEALMKNTAKVLREEVKSLTIIEQGLAYMGLVRMKSKIKRRFSHDAHSGALLLAGKPIIKDHGTASQKDVENSLNEALRYANYGLIERIQEEVEKTKEGVNQKN